MAREALEYDTKLVALLSVYCAAQFARAGYQRPDLLIDLPEASVTVFSWRTSPSEE